MANICILEACRSYQMNREIYENGQFYGSLSFYINKLLKTSKLDKDISWMEQIPKMIKQDIRLQLQDPVIETSL